MGPQICFEQGDQLPCNQPVDEEVAAVPVEVGSVHDTKGHVMSLGAISTMVAIITFFGTMIGFCLYSLYRKLQCVKEANEGILNTTASPIPHSHLSNFRLNLYRFLFFCPFFYF